MDSFFITLIAKKQLTHDVYELVYRAGQELAILPGQFFLCDTDVRYPKLRRSYSVSDYSGGNIHFIIKKLSDGKGGSKAICNQKSGHTMQVWGPTGHFVLPTIKKREMIFIGTGTGFAPLYFQTRHILENDTSIHIHFIFGVREEKDLFYQKIFQEWSEKYQNFSYQYCLSGGKGEGYFRGRVTEYLKVHGEIINNDTVYSICGSPAMVKEVREILAAGSIKKEQIFFEQY